MVEVDDPGSESRCAYRFERDGEWKVVIHAFERRGGGNYELNLDRFRPEALAAGEPRSAKLEEDGRAHFRVRPEPGSSFVLRSYVTRSWPGST